MTMTVLDQSIQAQSTDIQLPIPVEIFNHNLFQLRELTARELEHPGRLGTPTSRERNSRQYWPVDQDWALDHAARRFRETNPERSFFCS